MILAGDIGGTKTILGLFDVADGALLPRHQQSFASREHVGLEAIVTKFLSQATDPVTVACFGIAGPVVNAEVVTSNLPWVVSAHHLARTLGFKSVRLLNDLEAMAYGIAELKPEELVSLNEGTRAVGNLGLLAAGTGLGEASLFWDGRRYLPSASEGGHVDFAPRNLLEIDLLRFLMTKFGHVSVERILSGPGLFNIYDFLRSTGYEDESPGIAGRFTREDPSAVISAAALAGECRLCVKALDMFAAIYGATAGNVALMLKALGGIYIGGGIAPKIIEKLKDGTFLGAFLDKGRFSTLLGTIPVRVIMNDRTGLLGAARVAAEGAEQPG